MNKSQDRYDFIEDNEAYEEYINNLPKSIPGDMPYFIQMRTMAVTSNDGQRAVVSFVPDETREYTLLVPYNILLSYMQKKNKVARKNTVDEIARFGLIAETGLEIVEKEFLGSEIPVPNSLDFMLEHHVKSLVVITSFVIKYLRIIKFFSEKTGQPVWVHNSLLPRIFNSFELVGGKAKRHPQREAFRRYSTWLQAYHNFEVPIYELV